MMPSNSGTGNQAVMIPSINVIEGVLKTLNRGVVGYLGNYSIMVEGDRIQVDCGETKRSAKIRAPKGTQSAVCALAHQIQQLLQPKLAPRLPANSASKVPRGVRGRSSRATAPAH